MRGHPKATSPEGQYACAEATALAMTVACFAGQGGYDKAEQKTIAAFRSNRHPTLL